MTSCLILIALGAITLFFYVREKIRSYSLKAVLLKTIVSTLFIAVAVCAAWNAPAAPGKMAPFIILGLVFSLLGDIWLDLKYVYPEQDYPYSIAGFTVFGVAHVFYFIGIALQYYISGKLGHALIPVAAGVLMSICNLLLEKPMNFEFGRLKKAVFTYGIFLFTDLALSFSFALMHGFGETALNLYFIGVVLFTLSDLVLSGTYFGKGKDRPVDFILNYLFYYGGQFLIALSLLFVH